MRGQFVAESRVFTRHAGETRFIPVHMIVSGPRYAKRARREQRTSESGLSPVKLRAFALLRPVDFPVYGGRMKASATVPHQACLMSLSTAATTPGLRVFRTHETRTAGNSIFHVRKPNITSTILPDFPQPAWRNTTSNPSMTSPQDFEPRTCTSHTSLPWSLLWPSLPTAATPLLTSIDLHDAGPSHRP